MNTCKFERGYCLFFFWDCGRLRLPKGEGSSAVDHSSLYRGKHNHPGSLWWSSRATWRWMYWVVVLFFKELFLHLACTSNICVFSPSKSWSSIRTVDKEQEIKLLWPNILYCRRACHNHSFVLPFFRMPLGTEKVGVAWIRDYGNCTNSIKHSSHYLYCW